MGIARVFEKRCSKSFKETAATQVIKQRVNYKMSLDFEVAGKMASDRICLTNNYTLCTDFSFLSVQYDSSSVPQW